MDLFPPGPRDPDGMHAAVWHSFTGQHYALPDSNPLTLAMKQRAACGLSSSMSSLAIRCPPCRCIFVQRHIFRCHSKRLNTRSPYCHAAGERCWRQISGDCQKCPRVVYFFFRPRKADRLGVNSLLGGGVLWLVLPRIVSRARTICFSLSPPTSHFPNLRKKSCASGKSAASTKNRWQTAAEPRRSCSTKVRRPPTACRTPATA